MARASAHDIITTSKAESFRHIRDFLASQNGIADYSQTGAGYEIVDESYASGDVAAPAQNDWCVLRSDGEAKAWPLFYRLSFDSSSTLTIKCYLGWDAATHTGFGELYQSANINSGAAGCTVHLHADLDECHIVTQPGSAGNLYWSPFFRLGAGQTLYSGSAVQLADAIPARTVDTMLALPTWPDWAKIGKTLQNWDGTTMQLLAITAASETAQTITVASTQAMQAGSWLVEDLCYGVPYNSAGNAKSKSSIVAMPNRNGVLAKQNMNRIFPGLGTLGPESKYNERLHAPITIGASGAVRGQLKLAFETSAPSAQCEAWNDPATGQGYRVYTVYSGAHIAIMEA